MSNEKIRVQLRKGHPNRTMLARLADDTVVQVDENGIEISPDLVSKEMRGTGWFEADGQLLTKGGIEVPVTISDIGTLSGGASIGTPSADVNNDEDSATDEERAAAEAAAKDAADKAAAEKAEHDAAEKAAKNAEREAAAAARKAEKEAAKATAKVKAPARKKKA